MVDNRNQSLLSQQIRSDNICSQFSAQLAVTGTSSSVTFALLTGTLRTTFKITNKGSNGAYIAAGVGSATANTSTLVPQANCDYVGKGAILTQDFQSASGVVDTIAAIQDGGSTTLEVSLGYGQ